MLDSILWEQAKRGKTQKDYEEYLALGKMTRCHNDAFVILQKMHQLPDVKAFESQFQKSITQFYDALANAKTNEVLELCSDTIYRFLLRHRLTKPQLADYLNNNYTKKIKKRNFSITSDIEFTKGIYTGQEVGYAALFNLEQVMPSGKVRKNKVTMMFNPEGSFDDNEAEMKEAITNVKTGQVTFAIKDTNIDGVEVRKDEYIALHGKAIVCCNPSKVEATKIMIDGMIDEMSSICTLLVGEGATEEEVEEITSYINEKFEDVEVEVVQGNQPVYSFIIGVE
jgi:dihydroxyacetone kinase-like predicted kinase